MKFGFLQDCGYFCGRIIEGCCDKSFVNLVHITVPHSQI